MFELSAWDTLVYTLLILALMLFLSKLLPASQPAVRIRDNKNGHRWCYSDFVISFPLHCNACETFLLSSGGRSCVQCGVAACTTARCIRTVDRRVSCKAVSRCRSAAEAEQKVGGAVRHRWVGGNLPLDSQCAVCEEVAGTGPGLRDLRCVWCQRTVHTECEPSLPATCDYGLHRNLIVPPERVVSKQGRTMASPRRKIISELVLPPAGQDPNFRPLVVVGNNKSGNSDGAAVLAGFRRQLNPAQVVDLGETSMEEALEWCSLAAPRQCILLVCGGDGTIGWALNTVHKMALRTPPTLAIFPLGTGNDLARTLGYGSGSDSTTDISSVLTQLETAATVSLDRWQVQVTPKRHLKIRLPTSTIFMNNYLSIGVDALVTHNFHKARESPFYLISSRVINKLIYFSYGTKDVLERQCHNLNKKLQLFMDGKKIELPEIVVVLNIPFWGAGVQPWHLGTGSKEFNFVPNISDKKLEVFCVFSSFHIAQMQIGLSEPHRVGQAKEVKITLYDSVPMQIDGEPWEQHPAQISLSHHSQVEMLQLAA